jgi:hypothetical protein
LAIEVGGAHHLGSNPNVLAPDLEEEVSVYDLCLYADAEPKAMSAEAPLAAARKPAAKPSAPRITSHRIVN